MWVSVKLWQAGILTREWDCKFLPTYKKPAWSCMANQVLKCWGIKMGNFCQQVLKPLGFNVRVFTVSYLKLKRFFLCCRFPSRWESITIKRWNLLFKVYHNYFFMFLDYIFDLFCKNRWILQFLKVNWNLLLVKLTF